MTQIFNPKRVMRQLSAELLQGLFQSKGLNLEVDWESLCDGEVECVFNAWLALSSADRLEIDAVFNEINDMACNEDGSLVIYEEAIRQQRSDVIESLNSLESRHDKAAWTCIHAPDIWAMAVQFVRADSLSHGRYWIKRCDIPSVHFCIDQLKVEELQDAIAAFFIATQARGRFCKIDHYERASGAFYFFAHLDDYANTYVTLDHNGGFEHKPERRAFELVIVYDPNQGSLEVYARGGKKVYVPIQEIFCRVILGLELGPENRLSHPYQLNGLLRRDFEFPTDPEDFVVSVQVKKLRVSILGSPFRQIVLDSNPNGGPHDVYDMVDKYLNKNNLPTALLQVTQATIKITFDNSSNNLPRTMTFDLSKPNSSNLKSKPDPARLIAEKYIKAWGLDLVPVTQAA